MQAVVKEVIESVLSERGRVLDPLLGDIVYQRKGNGKYAKVRIISGQLYGTHGLSNFWDYENLETGEIEHDYGCFYSADYMKEGEKMLEAAECKEYINAMDEAEKRGMKKMAEAIRELEVWEYDKLALTFGFARSVLAIIENYEPEEIIERVKKYGKDAWKLLPVKDMTIPQMKEAIEYYRQKEAENV